jgi:hypothetical protein
MPAVYPPPYDSAEAGSASDLVHGIKWCSMGWHGVGW